jgi:ribosomal protein S18 acetylase RimI-like enzyme
MALQLALDRIQYRDDVHPGDRVIVRDLVSDSGFFNPEEIDVAVELVEERLANGLCSGYSFIFAEYAGAVLGYTCFGPIPGTVQSYDLYWIVVRNAYRGLGLGSCLLMRSERQIAQQGGSRVYVETSSRALYEPTRAFYHAHSYYQEAVLDDYYAPNDSKVIFVKQVA